MPEPVESAKMNKKILFPSLLVLFAFLVVGCTAPATLVNVTPAPTSIPATATIPAPTASEIPPTEIPTGVPTAIITPTNTIQHYPAGQEFILLSINMLDATSGWAIGILPLGDDHILRTEDGGTTWIDQTPPEEASAGEYGKMATGTFPNPQTAWVIYSNKSGAPLNQVVVWHTSDGGTAWQASQPLDLTDLNEFYNPSNLQFVDNQAGWMLVHVGVGMNHDYIVLYRSTDGGLTWQRVADPYNDTTGIMACQKTGMLFTDASHGWLTGDCNGVAAGVLLFKTSDGGLTWQTVSLPDPTDAPGLFTNMEAACGSYDAFFASNDLGHIGVRCTNYTTDPLTYQYYVYTTTDGGNTWTSSIYPGVSLYFLSMNDGWAIAPKIHHTTDGGLTWTPIADVTWDAKFDFIDTLTGWAITHKGDQVALVKTTDGGVHWTIQVPVVGE